MMTLDPEDQLEDAKEFEELDDKIRLGQMMKIMSYLFNKRGRDWFKDEAESIFEKMPGGLLTDYALENFSCDMYDYFCESCEKICPDYVEDQFSEAKDGIQDRIVEFREDLHDLKFEIIDDEENDDDIVNDPWLAILEEIEDWEFW